MSTARKTSRENQRLRTRKDLLQAAARLMSAGQSPSLEDVAEAALVSRATAYRYFPSIEWLLAEAPVEIAMPEPEALFAAETSTDPVARVERVDAAVEDVILANEAALRMMLVHTLQLRLRNGPGNAPARQNRRTPLIAAALEPMQGRVAPEALDRLTKALGLVIGTESAIASKDVLELDDADARGVRRWMIRALIEAAVKT